jgi:hypothetical protein
VFWNSAVIFELHVSCRKKEKMREKEGKKKTKEKKKMKTGQAD